MYNQREVDDLIAANIEKMKREGERFRKNLSPDTELGKAVKEAAEFRKRIRT